MKLKIVIISIFILALSVSYSQVKEKHTYHFPAIKDINAGSSVSLSKIDFNNTKTEDPPSKVSDIINRITLDRYFELGLDSNETNINPSDTYYNTVRLSDGRYSYYLVMFSQPSPVTSKIFAYDESTDSALETEIDYNIHAMYDIDSSNNITDSNLKKEYKMPAPDIEITDKGLKLTRLFHNGTLNAKETSIYKIEGKRLIQTYFNSEKL